ncbi:MAG: class I SAM-dependent methyltransferase [Fulvivirga sp.]|nr:class I SAM-dependent methyltransferase [Fulvivirga sp.]
MIEKLLKPEVQKFIYAHRSDDTHALALAGNSVSGVPMMAVSEQIKGHQKAKQKLPEWYETHGLVYPPPISMEQCSSEKAAKNKAELISGARLIDLTGGFGVDTFYLSKDFSETIYVEQNEWLCSLAQNNFKQLGKTIEINQSTAEDFINTYDSKADVIYLDPARRSADQQRVYRWEDCSPDVTSLLDKLFAIAPKILIKASPLLDLTQAVNALSAVVRVEVVAVDNDCKEVLYLLDRQQESQLKMVAKNFTSSGNVQSFSFTKEEEATSQINYSPPLRFLYEPNVAIYKAGAFKSVGNAFNLNKIAPNTHLYTSNELQHNFPGRIFEIVSCFAFNKKALKKHFDKSKANIAVRNFPVDVKGIRKKLEIKPGGDDYLFGVTDHENNKVIIHGCKISYDQVSQ